MRCKMFVMILFFVSALSPGFQLFPADSTRQEIDQWLVLGPASILPLESELLKSEDNILKFNHIPMQQTLPQKNEKVIWNDGNILTWQLMPELEFPGGNEKKVVYAAFYLEPTRWLQTDFVFTPNNKEIKIMAFLDGENINVKSEKDTIRVPLDLNHEKHLLIVKAYLPLLKSEGEKLTMDAFLEYKDAFKNETVKLDLEPAHYIKPENILNTIAVDQIYVAPDGKLTAVSLKQTEKGSEKSNSWIEILEIATGKTLFSSANFGKMSKFQWLKHSRGFTYTITNDEKTSLYQYDLNTHTQQCLIKDIKNFSSYWWAKNNSFLIYAISHTREDKEGYRYIKEIPDRTKFPEDRNSMFIFFPPANGDNGNMGVTHQISDEKQNFTNAVISPDSQKVLLTKEEPDYKKRPYLKSFVYLFDVKSHSLKEILTGHVFTRYMWAPDSRKLLIFGGPSAFDGLGNNLPKDVIPNEYETEAYIYNLDTQKAEVITKYFDPNISSASWNLPANIYFTVEETSFMFLFKYSIDKKTFTKMKTMVDVVQRIDFADSTNSAVLWGSGSANPPKLYKLDLNTNSASLLKDYNRNEFKDVTFGKWEDWNFKYQDGKTIVGLLYFPPHFDANKKYPCITYYYGGTSPVERNFGGRYPMEWYAANGYIVYVLQPTGATGFGQAASAVHVNDWGDVTSKEIIAAVKELVKTHPYIDEKRIGAMGASYGGFLTQYLATQTDVFAAYISHAGITSISSYWGEGDWGYNYSGFATADSFPWNRKDIYVDRSPLFLADKIKQPLLLLHGEDDNNVPPGESYQMFAALKLLGQDVALITFAGQQHFINDFNKRLQWMRTIIAWWDKYLKNQPEHWDYLYKK